MTSSPHSAYSIVYLLAKTSAVRSRVQVDLLMQGFLLLTAARHAKGRNRSKKQENVKRSTGRHAASARNLSKVFSPEGSSDCSSSLEARSNLKGRVVVFGELSLFFNTAENQDEMCFGTVTRMVMMASKGGVLVRFPDRDKNTAIYTGDVCTFNFA